MSTPKQTDTQPQRIIIRHTGGSKAGETETFELSAHRTLLFGRDTRSDVVYDPDREDLVSRQHARIEQDAENPLHFTVTDLESRNGTFVNKQRVMGVARISPSDEVQFGPGGPSFEFDLDPRPSSLMRRTRLADLGAAGAAAGAAAPTRETPAPASAGAAADRPSAGAHGASGNASGSAAGKTSVGKATVERMLSSTKEASQRTTLYAAAGLAVVLLLVAGGLYLKGEGDEQTLRDDVTTTLAEETGRLEDQQSALTREIDADRASRPLPISQIAAENTPSVVMIETAWKLIHSGSGQQVHHLYVSCEQLNQKTCPAYRQREDGSLEPFLTFESNNGVNRPIAQAGARGSGFVVSSDGFIMTNRHVAAPWYHAYQSFPNTPSLVYGAGNDGKMQVVGQTQRPPMDWIPALALENDPIFQDKSVEGELVYLDVTFAGDEQRFPAQLTSTNPTHDVAMVKINVPTALRAVELNDNYENLEVGEEVVVMGYPGLSPDIVTVTASQNWEKNLAAFTVPDPTTTPASIGRIIRGQQTSDGTRAYYSSMGDFYQLSTNETGAGNSGGPVFDRQGRVLGIFAASRSSVGGERLTYAVPVRFGMKLMGPGQVVKG